MDAKLRKLERQAQSGLWEDILAWNVAKERAGLLQDYQTEYLRGLARVFYMLKADWDFNLDVAIQEAHDAWAWVDRFERMFSTYPQEINTALAISTAKIFIKEVEKANGVSFGVIMHSWDLNFPPDEQAAILGLMSSGNNLYNLLLPFKFPDVIYDGVSFPHNTHYKFNFHRHGYHFSPAYLHEQV